MEATCLDVFEAYDIVKEFHYVHSLFCRLAFMANDAWMEEPHVCSTAGRRSNDIVVVAEELVIVLHKFVGHSLKARIAHRLSAAGLFLRVFDIEAERCKKPVCRYPHMRVEGIDIAGYE